MFAKRSETNIVYKCCVRLLEDSDILECEFQVIITPHPIWFSVIIEKDMHLSNLHGPLEDNNTLEENILIIFTLFFSFTGRHLLLNIIFCHLFMNEILRVSSKDTRKHCVFGNLFKDIQKKVR